MIYICASPNTADCVFIEAASLVKEFLHSNVSSNGPFLPPLVALLSGAPR